MQSSIPSSDSWNRPVIGNRAFIILAVLATLAGAVWYYSGTATVTLENQSQGHSLFYVDGAQACDAPAGTQCTVRLYSWKQHTLSAVTSYYDRTYDTPTVVLYPQRDAEYQFLSCGMTGTPRQNCGLFTRRSTPPAY